MVIIFLADGFEECEALSPLDMLRRVGVDVTTVSITEDLTVTGTHSVKVMADLTLSQYKEMNCTPDAVILPGGMPGAANLYNCPEVISTVKNAYNSNKTVCAICAAPFILGSLGILEGKKATCFPGFEDKLTGAIYTDDGVVTDGNIITAKSMGAAYRFGFAIVSKLCGEDKASALAESMIYNG